MSDSSMAHVDGDVRIYTIRDWPHPTANPEHVPAGSPGPATYAITIRAVIPNVHVDPAKWNLETVFGHIIDNTLNNTGSQSELLTDITSVELVPAGGGE